jgi:hypothetical protein
MEGETWKCAMKRSGHMHNRRAMLGGIIVLQ